MERTSTLKIYLLSLSESVNNSPIWLARALLARILAGEALQGCNKISTTSTTFEIYQCQQFLPSTSPNEGYSAALSIKMESYSSLPTTEEPMALPRITISSFDILPDIFEHRLTNHPR